MMKPIVSILLLCFLLGCKKESSLVLQNARIINVKTGEIAAFDILIEGTRIAKISEEELSGTHRVNLEGNYIIPALWDMHVHLHGDRSKLDQLFDHGVLGVRDLGAFEAKGIDSLITWKRKLVKDPTFRIPEIVHAGYINNDTTCYEGHLHVNTYKELVESASYLSEIGSSFYKVHNCFPDELLPQLDSLATVNEFVFGGHIPEGIDPLQYVRQFENINSIEHMSVLLRGVSFREEQPLNLIEAVTLLDGPYLDSLAVLMKEKNISLTPNLLSEVAFIKSYPEDKKEIGEAFLLRLMKYAKRFSEHGVNILAGTDTGSEFEAGKSLYQELELLSEAGFSNLEVLQAATMNADYANGRIPNLIKENSSASFIILNENPLEAGLTAESLVGIVHKGTYVDMNASEE